MEDQSKKPPFNEEFTQLQIFISARGLLDMDYLSKSDPYVNVFVKNQQKKNKQSWTLLGRTETARNNLNPNFKKSFLARQDIKFQVFDEDDKANSKNDDYIGSIQTTVGALAGAKHQTSILQLSNRQNKNTGKLVIRLEPCSSVKHNIRMKWRARIPNSSSWFSLWWWNRSNSYLKFIKIRQDNSFIEIFRTDTIKNSFNPDWTHTDIAIGKLVRDDSKDAKFKVECWDQGNGQDKNIDGVYLTIPQLLSAKLPFEITMNNANKTVAPILLLQKVEVYQKPTFFAYLQGGLQLNLSVAIDFTGSNGDPNLKNSLHYINDNQQSLYQAAIIAVGNILLNYDSDKKIPAFGFGAKTRFGGHKSNVVDHCFALSGSDSRLEAQGLQDLMNLYKKAIKNVDFSGPTLFAPLLRRFIDLARQSHEQGGLYQILLILTDGQIHDMEETVDLLVDNTSLPLSIIIVGVGNAEFQHMVALDGDHGLFNSRGVKAARDIVQFVPFNQVKMNADLLARELLAELPDQVVEYMALIGKKPRPPAELVTDIEIQRMMTEDENNQNRAKSKSTQNPYIMKE